MVQCTVYHWYTTKPRKSLSACCVVSIFTTTVNICRLQNKNVFKLEVFAKLHKKQVMSQFGLVLTFLPGSLSSWQGWSPFSSDLPPAFSFLLSLLLFLVFHSKIDQRCASVKLLSRSASLQSAPSSQLSLSLLFLSSSIFSPTPAPRSSPLNGGR